MDALSVLALAAQCATAAPAPVVAALALAETDGSIYAVQAGGERSDPKDFDAAVQAAAIALTDGAPVKIGLAGVPISEFDARNVAYTEGFSPCRNLTIAGELLREGWERFGGMEEHWRLAVLEFATGEPGTEGEFAKRFDAAMANIRIASGELPGRPTNAQAEKATAATQSPAPPSSHRQADAPPRTTASWDVYGRDPSRSLLIFTK